eukprot:4796685-Pleurochrysis_carterae.AAC.1
MLDCCERIGLACEEVWRFEGGVVIVKIDHVLLSTVHMWYAYVIDVVADDIACTCCRRHVCAEVNRIAVGAEAIFACNVSG